MPLFTHQLKIMKLDKSLGSCIGKKEYKMLVEMQNITTFMESNLAMSLPLTQQSYF